MGLDDMFDNGQSQTGSTKFSASGHIDTVKTFKNSFKMHGFNPESLIFDANNEFVGLFFQAQGNQ